jgi:putative inorganic carbon (HCO3(-)) transporter
VIGAVADAVRLPGVSTGRAARLALGLSALAMLALVGVGASRSPVLTLTGVVGLLFVLAASRELALGVALFTVLLFVQRIPGTPTTGLTVVKLAGTVLAILWMGRVIDRRSTLPFLLSRHPVFAYAVLLFPGWAFASTLWAESVADARISAFRLAQGALLLFIVFSAVRERRHVLWVLWAFAGGAMLTALIGLGGATATEDVGPYAETIRLAGGIGDPNELAAILVPSLAVTVGLLATTQTPPVRLGLLAMLLVMALALFLTQSRGGLVALAVTSIVAPVFAGPARPRVLAVVLTIAAFAISYYTLVAPPEQLERVTSFAAAGGTGRQDLWAISLKMFADRPVLGVGAGNFVVVEPRYAIRDIDLQRPDLVVDTPQGAHNTYLHELTELGVVGAVVLAAVLLGALGLAIRAIRRLEREEDRALELLARSLVVGVVGMLAAFSFISAAHQEQLWLLLGVLAALGTVARGAIDAGRGRATESA